VTDPSRTLSDIPDEGDPAASRTTPPEHAPAAAPEPEAQQAGEAHEEPATSVEPTVTTPPPAALGFPEGEPQSLHPAHLRTQLIAHWIMICVMSFGAFTILSSLTLGGKLQGPRLAVVPGLAAAGIGLLAWWGWRYQHLEHARTSFVISAAGCEIRRGVVWRRIITVPLSRIQHSDVTQGPLQRAYGLATLTLYTAGTEHAKIDLHGLAFETAMAIRQYLFERSEAHGR
jgi:membrane protein YdbS with pleckstrin-like domain